MERKQSETVDEVDGGGERQVVLTPAQVLAYDISETNRRIVHGVDRGSRIRIRVRSPYKHSLTCMRWV